MAKRATEMRIGAIILCGGHSRRMGTDKAWLDFDGENLLQRIVRIVTDVASPVVVVGRQNQRLPTLPPSTMIAHDLVADRGPLAGIASGFEALRNYCDAALITSCDHPLMSRLLLEALIERLGEHSAVCLEHEKQVQPIPGVYRVETRSVANDMLRAGALKLQDYVTRCAAKVLPAESMRSVDAELDSLRSANDPQTYQTLVELAKKKL